MAPCDAKSGRQTEPQKPSIAPASLDRARKIFERGKAIREAKKAGMMEKAQREEAERIKALLKPPRVSLPPEIAAAIFGNRARNGS